MDNASPSVAFSMMRLQRGLVRSGAAFDVTGTAGAASILGLILALVFAAAAAGTLAGCVESDVAAPSSTRAVGAGVVTSGLGGRAGEGGESTRVSSAGVGGAAACFDALGAETDPVVAFGMLGLPGSSNFVPTNTDATPSAITAPAGSAHLRTTSSAGLVLGRESVVATLGGSCFTSVIGALFAADSADSRAAAARSSLSSCSTVALGETAYNSCARPCLSSAAPTCLNSAAYAESSEATASKKAREAVICPGAAKSMIRLAALIPSPMKLGRASRSIASLTDPRWRPVRRLFEGKPAALAACPKSSAIASAIYSACSGLEVNAINAPSPVALIR